MTAGSNAGQSAAGRAVTEILLAAVVFAAAGAWPTPDVNEAAYLTKARHRADPAWCRGDFFLEDLGSTHGTELNKEKLPNSAYFKPAFLVALLVYFIVSQGNASHESISSDPF